MEAFVGTIIMFAGDFAPVGWAFCDGQLLPIRENFPMYSILGTQYGGDGKVEFALPNLNDNKDSLKYIICLHGIFPQRN